jgi:hypothetical protein
LAFACAGIHEDEFVGVGSSLDTIPKVDLVREPDGFYAVTKDFALSPLAQFAGAHVIGSRPLGSQGGDGGSPDNQEQEKYDSGGGEDSQKLPPGSGGEGLCIHFINGSRTQGAWCEGRSGSTWKSWIEEDRWKEGQRTMS